MSNKKKSVVYSEETISRMNLPEYYNNPDYIPDSEGNTVPIVNPAVASVPVEVHNIYKLRRKMTSSCIFLTPEEALDESRSVLAACRALFLKFDPSAIKNNIVYNSIEMETMRLIKISVRNKRDGNGEPIKVSELLKEEDMIESIENFRGFLKMVFDGEMTAEYRQYLYVMISLLVRNFKTAIEIKTDADINLDIVDDFLKEYVNEFLSNEVI